MDAATFRRHGHELVDWIAAYLEHPERYPVLSRVAPGAIAAALPAQAPEEGEPFEAIMADFERVLVPGLTHWNHPGFFAYFNSTASGPGILAELLTAAVNQQAMLWRTSPSATELERVALSWLRQLIGLPDGFDGVIYDTASISTLHALAAAREAAIPGVKARGLAGSDVSRVCLYCSTQAHSSVEKAAIALGFGQTALRRIPIDGEFRMIPDALESRIRDDRANGLLPLAVVATVGTTSTTSVDPVPAIARICTRERVWLHVDAAYAGAAAILPSHAACLSGAELADSLVVNPHKWLFTPVDLSALYCRHMDTLRAAFALTPEYLRSSDGQAIGNLMDLGIPLGRRFRALKLWMVLRSFGRRGLQAHLARHCELARQFGEWVDAHPAFARVAPVPFSVVCFRWTPDGEPAAVDRSNAALLEAVNRSGEVFLSHTELDGRYTLRLAIGHEQTTLEHVERVWQLLQEHALRLRSGGG
jgi:aromatic-L-amino-acid decarboxylase